MSGNILVLSNDLNVITAEIIAHKGMLAQNVFEIGARLKHAKENNLSHGRWEKWCDEDCGISPRNARRYIRVFDRFSNRSLVSEMGMKKMDMLAEFTDEELETPTELPTGEFKKPIEMSQKEIEQYKKNQREAEERANKAEHAARHYEALWNQEKNKPTRIVTKEVEKVVVKEDKFRLEQQRNEIKRLQSQVASLNKKAELNEREAKEYADLKSKIEFMNREKNDLHRQIESATALSGLSVEIDNFLKTKLAPIRYSRTLERMDSEVAVKNLTDIIVSVEHWCEDMRRHLPSRNRIVVEVNE